MRQSKLLVGVDLMLVLSYIAIIFFGCLAIYSSETNENTFQTILFFSRPGKNLFFLFLISFLVLFIQFTDYRFVINISFPLYLLSLALLLIVLIYGITIGNNIAFLLICEITYVK